MVTLLLAVIYIAFISLGLPDSVLGSAWPVMYRGFDVPVSYVGIVTILIAGGTIVSSLLSDKLTRKLGAGLVTTISVFITAAAMLGFSFSNSFILICVFAVPYGLGAGAVDAALNNFVALHFSSRHMNWLHCFWGVGASIGPYIMGGCLTNNLGWPSGYRILSLIQIVLTAILFISLPLWKKQTDVAIAKTGEVPVAHKKMSEIVKIDGVWTVLLGFFGYCALESTAGIWASSYLVLGHNIDAYTASFFASMFYIGITAGRLISGFVSDKIGDKNLIRIGIGVLFCGILLVWLPTGVDITALAGLIVIGFGCAPIYPSVIHSTPSNFGKENSQALVGIQMACAYAGTTAIPPLFGLIANYVNILLFPPFLFIFAVLLLVMTEILNRKNKLKAL